MKSITRKITKNHKKENTAKPKTRFNWRKEPKFEISLPLPRKPVVIIPNPPLSSLSKSELRKLGFTKQTFFEVSRLSKLLSKINGRPKYSYV